MNKTKCPYCGKQEMELEIVPRHTTRLGGADVSVDDARISRCGNCNRIMVAAEELKRWRDIQRRQLQESGHTPAPQDVREIRRSYSLAVTDMAALLGVTRQAVHGWERSDSGPMPMGSAALILNLLKAELEGRCHGVFAELASAAQARGQLLQPRAISATPRQPGRSRFNA
jgi:putative zinc finger/helix-turn-helix YgiT family protein